MWRQIGRFLVTLMLIFSFYYIYDARMNPIYKVECDDNGYCEVYDMKGYLRFIINPDGDITDDRLNPKGGIDVDRDS